MIVGQETQIARIQQLGESLQRDDEGKVDRSPDNGVLVADVCAEFGVNVSQLRRFIIGTTGQIPTYPALLEYLREMEFGRAGR